MENLSRHERQELKRQQRDQQREQSEHVKSSKEQRKKTIMWSLVGIAVIAVITAIILLPKNESSQPKEPYSKGQVHWHATLKVFVCGEEKLMPAPTGEHHLGLPLLHTHEDRLIHIEGVVWNSEEIALGRYMEVIGQNFKDDELLDKKNGDLCNDQPGKVKLFVNGKENSGLTQYVIKDGDEYILRFEP